MDATDPEVSLSEINDSVAEIETEIGGILEGSSDVLEKNKDIANRVGQLLSKLDEIDSSRDEITASIGSISQLSQDFGDEEDHVVENRVEVVLKMQQEQLATVEYEKVS